MADTTQTVINKMDPDIAAKKLGIYDTLDAYLAGMTDKALPAQSVAGLTQDQLDAMELTRQGIGAYQGYLSGAQDYLGQAAKGYADVAEGIAGLQGPLSQEMIQRYMDPYQDLVLQDQLSEMSRQADMQRQQAMASATRAGAFGGSRQAVVEAELGRNLADMQNKAINQAMSQNYAQALAAAEREQQRALQGYNSLGNLAQGLGTLGVQSAALGETAQNMSRKELEDLYSIGATQQQMNQMLADRDYAAEAAEFYRPLTEASFLSDFLTGVPSSQMQMAYTSKPDPSLAQQVIGLAGGAVSGAKAAETIGIL